jgi:hypothetical protein
MKCQTPMGICTLSDQVVEESDVAVCGYVIEDLEAIVMALSWSKTTIVALVVGFGDINAVIKQPVDGFSRVGIIPNCESAVVSIVSTTAEQGILQNTMPIDFDVISKFHKQLDQINGSLHASRSGTSCRVGAMF